MRTPHPLLLQLNTQVVLHERGESLGRAATLDDIAASELRAIAAAGFHYVWMLGVWEIGEEGPSVSRRHPGVLAELATTLPDWRASDISGSPFAIRSYTVRAAWGGDEALARLRRRLHAVGVGLILDLVPNHVALDHPWLEQHPEFLVGADADALAREPHNYVMRPSRGMHRVFAHGRDPYFPGWPDTLQIDLRHPGARAALRAELAAVAARCDGVRCDMAMLLCPDVVQRTWGAPTRLPDGHAPVFEPFWPSAITEIRARTPGFVFIAEAYWDRERQLQEEGFDFTYDKALYDHLRSADRERLRAHLGADAEHQRKSVHFLENHDEPRAAAVFPSDKHRAAALVTALAPGMRMFHHGQTEGRRARVSIHASRRLAESVDPELHAFYEQLLAILRDPLVHDGAWAFHPCGPAHQGDDAHGDIVVYSWQTEGRGLIVAVNFSDRPARGYAEIDLRSFVSPRIDLGELSGRRRTTCDAHALRSPGLFLDLGAWAYQVMEVRASYSSSDSAAT